MQDKEKLILEFMSEETYVPMKAKEMALLLSVPKEEYQNFTIVLKQLEEDYKIRKNRKSRYSLMEKDKFYEGVFRANEKGFGFVKIEGVAEEVYIGKSNTKGALDGDKVIIEIADNKDKEKSNHKEGKVVKILSHEKNTIVGTFTNSKNFGFVVPDNKNFGTDIFVSKKNINKAKNNDKVVVKITKYPEKGKNAEGEIIEILGNINQAGVDMLSLIKDYNLPYEFPEDVIKEAEDISMQIDEKEINKRTDFRNEEIFTIDGEDAKDLDDAVQVKKLDNGNYELGVHIADVSHYVKEGSKLDKEAIVRGTSIYMLDRVIPMLPKELSNGICSLNQKEDRLTISVIMEINKEGQVISSNIVKGIINVTKRMNYTDVSNYVKEGSKLDKEAIVRGTSIYMLDRVIPMLPKELSNGICSLNQKEDRLTISVIMEINKEGQVISSNIVKGIINVTKRMNYTDVAILLKDEKEIEDKKQLKIRKENKQYIEHFKRMEELAQILKTRREKQGSLNLDLPESKIILDENGIAIDIKKYELTFANEIIEQFMLTANETIAERFFWLEAPFIYRVHEVPDEEKIDELNKFLFNFGYKIKGSKDNIHPKAFAEVLENIKGKPEERVISNLILRTLKVARYESQNKGHFGIASKYYCHFTSPIRRYPDLFIHRMISKYLEKNYNVDDEFKSKYGAQSTSYAEKSSEREKIAQKVERDSVDLKMAEFMQNKIGEEYEGIVSSVTSFGIFVELENTVEGLIRFDDLGDDYFIYDENKKTLWGERTKISYKIGDKVKIRVKNANKILRQIDFKIIEND